MPSNTRILKYSDPKILKKIPESLPNYGNPIIDRIALTMLYQLFQSARTEAEFNDLLELTFTENERAMMLERWRIFDALDRGLSQREVAKDVPCSIVTATRGAKVYRDHREAIQKYLEIWRK